MFSLAVTAIVIVIWLLFAAVLASQPDTLDSLWHRFTGLPLAAKGAVGVLTLPWTLGLWAWESPWPVALRYIVLAGLAFATVYAFVQGAISGT
jgi:hypothetical protein